MKQLFKLTLATSLLFAHGAFAADSETFLEAPGPQGPLKAIFLVPNGARATDAPTVLIIPGSGPTDHDGNGPLGLKAAPYRLLAGSLARDGVSTVRIDKRGMFASASAIPDANKVSIQDYANDVHVWISAIKSMTGASCVWVLGHSEGGLVALAAAQHPDGLCGLILIATAGRTLGAVLREQITANPANAPLLVDAETTITKLEHAEHVEVSSMHPALQRLFVPAVQDFLISSVSLNPAVLLGAYRGPVLILQGDNDLQVGVEDAELLGKANAAAKVVIFQGVNHVLKAVEGKSRAANFSTYGDPTLPLADGIAPAVAGFIRAQRR